ARPTGGGGRAAGRALPLPARAEGLPARVEGTLAGRPQPAGDQPGDRPSQADHAPVEGKDAVEPPADDVGVAQEPQRLTGGGAIDDQDVEPALAGVPEDLQQAKELLQAGEDDQLLAVDVGDIGPAEDAGQPALHRAPPAL